MALRRTLPCRAGQLIQATGSATALRRDPDRLSPTLSWAAPLTPGHPVQQAFGQQARAAGTHLPHVTPPLAPRHPSHHHQLGAPGATENPQALEPELPATRTPPTALGRALLQGGEAAAGANLRGDPCRVVLFHALSWQEEQPWAS